MKNALRLAAPLALISAAVSSSGAEIHVPQTNDYVIIERGPHHRVWERTGYIVAPDGQTFTNSQTYTELATGMHYWTNGQWLDSKEQIEILADGSARAIQGQHKVFFPADIYAGAIEWITPDGNQLSSRPLGLSYFDGTNSVLIAELTNSVGQLQPNLNQLVYPNAFDGVDASLRYTYTRAGFEQDVIITGALPEPEEFGLDSATTRLQVLTEFFSPPIPHSRTTTVAEDGLTLSDQTLSFGQMTIGNGQAFCLGSESEGLQIAKQWVTLDGRQFLVEERPIPSIAKQLRELPQKKGASSQSKVRMASRGLAVPQRKINRQTRPAKIQTAKANLSRGSLIMDFAALNSTQTNYTFAADTTYYISGAVTLLGTNTCASNHIVRGIKAGNWLTLQGWRSVTWKRMNL